MRLALPTAILVSSASLLALGGCVPQSQYDDLMNAYRSKEQQLLQLQNEFDTSRTNEEALRRQLAEAAADLARARELVGGDKGALDALQKRYEDLLAQVNALSPLPESVNSRLRELADANPEIFEYDEKRGMLRFKSDVTFDLGSAKLTAKAESVLAKVASILNTSEARDLEVRVVGHTDNVPIRKSSTAAQHPTNIHLSAHRSISVRDALASDGVDANRFMVAGYGEFRPIASNSARGNEMNRRVELYLVPMPAVEAVSTRSANPAPSTAKTVNATEEGENLK
ncbi:MAG: OmpA family protein [Planctomycetota bacterium]|nr:OmpA family protein [Planctomycetota bacterium]